MVRRILRSLSRGEQGITGIETAIILIAFVVVASVFAYTVLSAGIFSSEKGKEAVYSGLETSRSSLAVAGPVLAKDTDGDDDVDEVVFVVMNALDGEAINFNTTTDSDSDGLLSDESPKNHTTTVTYLDSSQRFTDLAWTVSKIGKEDGDNLLEVGEKFEVTVKLTALTTPLGANKTFSLEIKPQRGSALIIERVTPSVIDKVMDLR